MIVPGFASVEVAGVPPGKVHAYVSGLAPQLLITGEGVIEAVPQDAENAANVTVGGCFTTTVLVVVNVPQGLVAANVTT